jgi:heme/copper-type cytochrome/quinol oxidase subunit 2
MKPFLKKFLVPAIVLATPSLLFSLYNLTHYEQIQAAGVFKYMTWVDFVLTLSIMLFFVGRYRKSSTEEGVFTFKKIFSHAYRIVVVWALFAFLASVVISYTFKEETKKLSEITLEIQIKELTNKKGAITAKEKQIFDRTREIVSNPLTSSFSYSVAILFTGILHCLIVSAVYKQKAS